MSRPPISRAAGILDLAIDDVRAEFAEIRNDIQHGLSSEHSSPNFYVADTGQRRFRSIEDDDEEEDEDFVDHDRGRGHNVGAFRLPPSDFASKQTTLNATQSRPAVLSPTSNLVPSRARPPRSPSLKG